MHIMEKAVVALVLVAVLAGVVLSHVDEPAFRHGYVEEDGPIEWGTVLALLFAALVCCRRFLLLRRRRPVLFLAATALLGALFVFGAGEEISWGQRMLGFESPSWFMEYNVQRDTNIHNLKIGGVKINKLVFSHLLGAMIVAYVLLLPILYRWNPTASRLISAFAIPVPRARHAVFIVATVLLVYGAVRSSKRGELAEFGLSWMVALCVAFPANAKDFRVNAGG